MGQRREDADRLGMALEYFQSAKYHESLLLFAQLNQKYRLNPRYKAFTGVCYYYEWDYENAVKYLDEAIPKLKGFAPHERSFYYWADAESHFNLLRYEEALPLYQEMLKLCYLNEKADAYYRMGLCYMFTDQWYEANYNYKLALEHYLKYRNVSVEKARIAQLRNMINGCQAFLPKPVTSLQRFKVDDGIEELKHIVVPDLKIKPQIEDTYKQIIRKMESIKDVDLNNIFENQVEVIDE